MRSRSVHRKETTLRGVVQELHLGYMVCYYYGYRALAALRAASPLAEREFTETTFACGYTTLEVARRALAARARDEGAEGV